METVTTRVYCATYDLVSHRFCVCVCDGLLCCLTFAFYLLIGMFNFFHRTQQKVFAFVDGKLGNNVCFLQTNPKNSSL